jgi:hypothetical protein
MLDWNSSQDLRIFALSRVDVPLDVITKRLMRDAKTEKFLLVPPLSSELNEFLKNLISEVPCRVAAIRDWPGYVEAARDVAGVRLENVPDWFSFLGIQRK